MARKNQHRPVRSYGARPRDDERPRRPTRDSEPDLVHVAGLEAVQALFATSPERIERLFFLPTLKNETGDLCLYLAQHHRPYRVVREDELTRVAGTAMHGGIVAMATPRPVLAFDWAQAEQWAKAGEPLLVLDGIGNPHNLGAIARTAAFFGLKRLVLSDHREQAQPSDAAFRVAKGGLEHLTVYRAERLPEALKRLRTAYMIAGAALGVGRTTADLAKSDRPLMIVLGNEEDGLPRDTLAACEASVTIPGAGTVQSLNVAASAAILIHEMMRGRRA